MFVHTMIDRTSDDWKGMIVWTHSECWNRQISMICMRLEHLWDNSNMIPFPHGVWRVFFIDVVLLTYPYIIKVIKDRLSKNSNSLEYVGGLGWEGRDYGKKWY